MRSTLRAWWLNVNASYWFIPTLLTIGAFLLSLLTVYLDRNGGSEWLTQLGWFEPSRPDGARAQLTVIASAMIAIASTVFAITIAAVAYASGNYGPRLLTNFMNDRGNQVSLGVFIATFVYNLMILRVVRDVNGVTNSAEAAIFVPQISVVISTATVIIAVGVLVFFLHHIPASIRINSVLAGIGRHLVHDIEKRFPVEGGADDPPPQVRGEPITATSIGYIEIIDFSELDEIAKAEGLVLALKVRTGDFIHPHLPVVEASGGPLSEKLLRRILGCFSLGSSRTPTQNLEFLIDELVEISLRALSPGINDPFTAVTSLHWMGAAMAKLADRTLSEGPEQKNYDPGRVQPIPDDFDHFLVRSFGGVRASAAANPIAGRMFLQTLAGVAMGATSSRRRQTILEEARLLVRQAETVLDGPALQTLHSRMKDMESEFARRKG